MHRRLHDNGVITYTFETLSSLPVAAHVSTRHGGVSPAPWNTLNFSVKRGDEPTRVAANRARFAAATGVRPEDVIVCEQVHGTAIAKVDWSDAGSVQAGCDGLITDAPNLPLALVFADCVPLLLYDRVHHALGIVHAGWRGTVNGATTALLWAMQAAYATQVHDLHACIGPSIGPESYEVGTDVLELARTRFDDADACFTFPNGPGLNPYLDLWRANARQLVQAGVPEPQIEIAGIDTARNTVDFFSHRAEQGRCGLFSMMARLLNADDGDKGSKRASSTVGA